MSLNLEEAAVVKAMLAKGEKQHDIAAHFGVNGGRIAEIAQGKKFRHVTPATATSLPTMAKPAARYIDPKAPAETQFGQLMAFVNQPPETSRVLIITPELATIILERMNEKNRRQRRANITRFAAAMDAKEWVLTGDTIKFSRARLLDGQNRLAACVRSGVPFKTHVVFGVDENAFTRIDAGAKRTNPDTFQVAAVPYHAIVGPAVRWLMIGDGDRGQTFDNQALLSYYRREVDEKLMHWAASQAASSSGLFMKSALAAHLYLFGQKDKRKAMAFADDIIQSRRNGLVLKKRIDELKRQNMGRMHELQFNAFLRIAWKHERDGKAL